MRIAEIFVTIEGEGIYMGWPTIFIRTGICPFHCVWCDTGFKETAKIEYRDMDVPHIIDVLRVKWAVIKRVCITGGEPLLEPDLLNLLKMLVKEGYKVHVETSGLVSIRNLVDQLCWGERYRIGIVMDIKTPGSGAGGRNVMEDWGLLMPGLDCLKAVIESRQDYEFVKVVRPMLNERLLVFSPAEADGKFPVAGDLSNWMIEDGWVDSRIGIQMHKVIGVR